jgi:hypothetical protein
MEDNVVHIDTKRRPSLTNEVGIKARSVTSSIKVPQLGLKGTIKVRENLESVAEPYSKTEIDSKFDVVNQKIEHNQEKMELIVSTALDKIGGKIAHLETTLDKNLSAFKAEIFGFVIFALLVPFLTLMVPIITESIKDMNSRNSLAAPADNQSKSSSVPPDLESQNSLVTPANNQSK